MSSRRLSPTAQTALARARHWHQVSPPCLCKSRFTRSGFQPAEAKETPLLRALQKDRSGTDCLHALWPERHGRSESEGLQGKPELTRRRL